MKIVLKAIVSTILVGGLVSGCGGSQSFVLDPGANGLPLGQNGLTTQTLTTQFVSQAFTAGASQTQHNESGGSYTNTATNRDVTVTIVDADTIRLVVGGETIVLDVQQSNGTLSGIDGSVFGDASGDYAAVFGRAGSGTSLQSIFFGYLDKSDIGTSYGDTFLVSGFETDTDQITALQNTATNATYTGPATVFLRETDGAANPTQHTVLSGSNALSLGVDFANSTVSGTISGTTDADIGGGTTILTITGAITGNEINGTFTKSGTSTLNVSNTALVGNFYGQSAVEIAGTLKANISGAGVAEPTTAAGFFLGQR